MSSRVRWDGYFGRTDDGLYGRDGLYGLDGNERLLRGRGATGTDMDYEDYGDAGDGGILCILWI